MNTRRWGVFVLLLILAVAPVFGLTVKLGSPFPEGTPWDTTLKKMAAEWAEISNGRVRMRIYPGGVAGNEGDMIRKMRIGQLDMAVLSPFGNKLLVPESFLFSLPGLIRDERELDYVIDTVLPRYADRFREEGFEVLTWSKTGWVYFFTKRPIEVPDDLRRMKMSVNSTDEEVAANFKALRFNVVPLSMAELMVSLQSGLADAYYAPPMVSAAFQWFALAPKMLDFRVSPVLGNIVISDRTWRRIPANYREDLRAAIEKVSLDFFLEAEKLNQKAMEVMLDNGLDVNQIDEDSQDEWRTMFEEGHRLVVGDGKWISTREYEGLIDEFTRLREDR